MRDRSRCAKPDEHRSSPIDDRRTVHASKGVTALPQTPLHRSRAERRAAAAVAQRSARRDASVRVPSTGAGRLRIWWIGGAVLLTMAAGVTWRAASGRPPAPGPMLGQHVPDEGFGHVAVGSPIRDKANPPASGPHYPVPAPACLPERPADRLLAAQSRARPHRLPVPAAGLGGESRGVRPDGEGLSEEQVRQHQSF